MIVVQVNHPVALSVYDNFPEENLSKCNGMKI